MSDSWSVNAVEIFCRMEITKVLHSVWSGIRMVVSSFSVMAEAVSVLHAQVKALKEQYEK